MPEFTHYSPYRRPQGLLALLLAAITKPVKVLYLLALSAREQQGA